MNTDFVVEILPYVRSKESKLRHVISGNSISFCCQGESRNKITWFTCLINVNYSLLFLSTEIRHEKTKTGENVREISMSRIRLFLVEVYLKLNKDQVPQTFHVVLKPNIPAFVLSLVFIIPVDN